MSLKSILSFTFLYLRNFSKQTLINKILILRDQYLGLVNTINALEQENNKLKDELTKLKVQQVNKQANQPTSKQPEWELKGVGNDGQGKKKGRGNTGRKGAGNKAKDRTVTHRETAKVEQCDVCGRDLSEQPPLQTENVRIIEDIPSMSVSTQVIEVRQEKKYCAHCSKVVTARTELALPKTDIGLNTTTRAIYLWVTLCLPYTRISSYLKDFFGQIVSTSGLASHLIGVARIMKAVYEEIAEDVKSSIRIHADETGWRVNGKLCWLWVFGNSDASVYTIDNSRGSDVVKKMLGEFFDGVLVIDGWRAYLFLICDKQSCMAHLLRKIRKFYFAFPNLGTVFKFYIRLRKILRDGERLQLHRKELGEDVFKRRLDKLHNRLDELLRWPTPNHILKDIIEKVERQRPYILTFVEHDGVPCHNNHAESLIRKGVMKRKVSFGSKSQEGAEAYAIMLSIYTTCQLRKISFVDFMMHSLKHYIRTKRPMLLKEYMTNQAALAMAA
jgi:transposase